MLDKIYYPFDGEIASFQEVAATPGLDVIIDFENVTDFDYVFILANYDGGTTQSINIMLYDWSSNSWHLWDSNDGIEETITNHSFWVPCSELYVGTDANAGRVRVRFLHPQLGNAAHNFYIDAVALYDREKYWQDLIDALEASVATLEAVVGQLQLGVNNNPTVQDDTGGTSSGGGVSASTSGTGTGVYPGKC